LQILNFNTEYSALADTIVAL